MLAQGGAAATASENLRRAHCGLERRDRHVGESSVRCGRKEGRDSSRRFAVEISRQKPSTWGRPESKCGLGASSFVARRELELRCTDLFSPSNQAILPAVPLRAIINQWLQQLHLCKKLRANQTRPDSTQTTHHLRRRPSSSTTVAARSSPQANSIHWADDKMAAARGLGFIYSAAIPAAIGVGLLQSSMYDVKGGTRAVIFDRLTGVKETVVNEGTHFLIPWLQKAIIFDVRTKPRIIPTTTGSKDLQMVSLTLRVLHRPEVQALPKIYQVRNASFFFSFSFLNFFSFFFTHHNPHHC